MLIIPLASSCRNAIKISFIPRGKIVEVSICRITVKLILLYYPLLRCKFSQNFLPFKHPIFFSLFFFLHTLQSCSDHERAIKLLPSATLPPLQPLVWYDVTGVWCELYTYIKYNNGCVTYCHTLITYVNNLFFLLMQYPCSSVETFRIFFWGGWMSLC